MDLGGLRNFGLKIRKEKITKILNNAKFLSIKLFNYIIQERIEIFWIIAGTGLFKIFSNIYFEGKCPPKYLLRAGFLGQNVLIVSYCIY